MNTLTALAALLLAGLCDRVRGGWPSGRPKLVAHAATWLAGALMAYLISHDWRLALAAAPLVGELSWRHDAGWRGDWVRGTGSVAKAMRWGALWAVPFVPLAGLQAYLGADPTLAVYVLAGPLGALLAMLAAVRLPSTPWLDMRYAWARSEVLELPVIGLLAWLPVEFLL